MHSRAGVFSVLFGTMLMIFGLLMIAYGVIDLAVLLLRADTPDSSGLAAIASAIVFDRAVKSLALGATMTSVSVLLFRG